MGSIRYKQSCKNVKNIVENSGIRQLVVLLVFLVDDHHHGGQRCSKKERQQQPGRALCVDSPCFALLLVVEAEATTRNQFLILTRV